MNELINSVGILGIGTCVPDKVLTNQDLEKMVETSDEWIIKRTGISERRILNEDEPAYELAIKAAERALEDAGIRGDEIGLIIVTTNSPDYLAPITSCIVQGRIGAVNAAAFDMNAACTGFIYGLTTAQQFISTGYYKYVLLISVEGMSKVVDWKDRNTCVLFGDGAGALVLGAVEEGYGIIGTDIHADGSASNLITIPCCTISEEDIEKRPSENKMTIRMDGGEVFKFAVKTMESSTRKVLAKSGLTLDDVKLIIPHQANVRIIDGAIKRLGVSEDKVMSNVRNYGNISSASIPVAFEQALKEGRVSKGDNLVFVGFGGGLTWGSAVLKWSK